MNSPGALPLSVAALLDAKDAYFVLTESLEDFAGRQRDEAADDPSGSEHRVAWADCADSLRELVDEALNAAAGDDDVPARAQTVLTAFWEGWHDQLTGSERTGVAAAIAAAARLAGADPAELIAVSLSYLMTALDSEQVSPDARAAIGFAAGAFHQEARQALGSGVRKEGSGG